MTITWQQIAWGFGIFAAWNGFLLGMIKLLLSRMVKGFEDRLAASDEKAGKAVSSVAVIEKTTTVALTQHKELVADSLGAMRLELSQKTVCSNHQRMEQTDDKLFNLVGEVSGNTREVMGVLKEIKGSLKIVNEYLITREK